MLEFDGFFRGCVSYEQSYSYLRQNEHGSWPLHLRLRSLQVSHAFFVLRRILPKGGRGERSVAEDMMPVGMDGKVVVVKWMDVAVIARESGKVQPSSIGVRKGRYPTCPLWLQRSTSFHNLDFFLNASLSHHD